MYPLRYFLHHQDICFKNSKSSLSQQNLSWDFAKLLTCCKLFMPFVLSPSALILWLAPSICVFHFREDSFLIAKCLALSFQCFSVLQLNFRRKIKPNQLTLLRTWQFYWEVFIFEEVNCQSQISLEQFRCNWLRSFLLHWQLHGKLVSRLDILAKEKDGRQSYLS